MSTFRRALFVSAIATGTAAAAWMLVSLRRTRPVEVHANAGARGERSRIDEIEALTQQQKDLMLRELSEQV